MNTPLRWLLAGCLLVTGQALRADSYTVNVPPGYSALANQLNNAGNDINSVLGDVTGSTIPDGTRVYKYDCSSGSYTLSSFDAFGGAWDVSLTLNPGDGWFIFNPASTSFQWTFTGTPNVPVLPLALAPGACCLVSRQTNGPGSWDNIVGVPATNCNTVYRFIPGHNPLRLGPPDYAVYSYVNGAWDPAPPVAAIGESLWVCNTDTCPPCPTNPPVVLSVVPNCASNTVTLTFSQPMDPASVGDPASYQLSYAGGIVPVGPASVLDPLAEVVSLATGPLVPGLVYTLQVATVFDACGNPSATNVPVSFSCPTNCSGPRILTEPTNVTAVANCCGTNCARFSVVASGTNGLTYQWRRDGTDLPGATASVYLKCPVTLADDGSVYTVVVSNACGSTNSTGAMLTVRPDLVPLLVRSATADCGSNRVIVTFNKCLGSTATNSADYAISFSGGTIGIGTIQAQADGHTVWVFANQPFSGGAYSLTVSNVADPCGNLVVTNIPITITSPCGCLQITNELIQCVPANGSFLYSLSLQNFSGVPVSYIFLFPESPCATAVPDIFTLHPALAPGQATNLSTILATSTNCGTNLCFLISLHDSNNVNCCSLEHCVTLPVSPPVIHCSTNITTVCTSPAGAQVFYTVTASPGCNTNITLACNPPPGSVFPLGATAVSCTATDATGASASCKFLVTVTLPQLTIRLSGTTVIISWSGAGTLQQADNLTGPWEDIVGAPNPYQVPATATHRFYRIRK